MPDAMQIAATGMRAHQTELDTIANNVANVNTNGFRRNLVSFATVAAATAPTDGVESGVAPRADAPTGAGTLAQVSMSTLGGTLQHTNEPLDIAIDGNGFIAVSRSDGTPAFARNGRLKLDAGGQLTLADGTALAGQITIPPDTKSIHIDDAGHVTAIVGAAETVTDAGQIELADFANPSGLQAVGDNLYVATADSGEMRSGSGNADGFGRVRQGYLEGSNVQLIDEMVSLMLAQRAFELNSRVVQAADQMLSITNALFR